MKNDLEPLASWAVEIDTAEKSSLVLVINGRKVKLPCVTAELLSRALHGRCLELATAGVDTPANLP